jgi:long-chain acyl-CoA synthetase
MDENQDGRPAAAEFIAAIRRRMPEALTKGMSLAVWAELLPRVVAVHGGDQVRTFSELNARANQLTRALRARGVRAGDGVALLCSNRCEFAEVYAATRRAGVRLTPVNWHLSADEAAYVVRDSDSRVLVAEARFEKSALRAAALGTEVAVRLACGGALRGFEDYDAALGEQDPHDISDPVMGTSMLYTSGTTGRPKGVERTAPPQALGENAASPLGQYVPGRSVHLCTGPLYHSAPLSFSLAVPLLYGSTVVMMDGWDAERMLALIERHRVTHTHVVPTMIHRLLALPEAVRTKYDTGTLRYLIHGAAPCSVAMKRRLIDWLGPIVTEYYAATEGMASIVDSATWLTKPGTVGVPIELDGVRILDDAGNSVQPGSIGTVYLKAGADRFSYHKDPHKTESVYRGDYFTLGDVGYLDEDGYLFLTDRSVDLVISGGVNVYPAEVEQALLEHVAVADVGVIGVENPEWGEEVKAVVVLQPGRVRSDALAAELIAFCRERIAHFKCPRSVDFVSDLPRTETGKLNKRELRQRYRARTQ